MLRKINPSQNDKHCRKPTESKFLGVKVGTGSTVVDGRAIMGVEEVII